MYWPVTCEVVVDQVPPEPPAPPVPQAAAAKEMRPLLSVWRQRVPEPPRLEAVRVVASRETTLSAVAERLPIEAVLALRSVVEALPEA